MYLVIKIRYNIHIQCHGNYIQYWGKKNSIICLTLTFLKIPHKQIWVSWRVVFEGLGVQNDTQMPCLLRLWIEVSNCCQYIYSLSGKWRMEQSGLNIFTDIDFSEQGMVVNNSGCLTSSWTLMRPSVDWLFPRSFLDHVCRVGREVNKNIIKILFFFWTEALTSRKIK